MAGHSRAKRADFQPSGRGLPRHVDAGGLRQLLSGMRITAVNGKHGNGRNIGVTAAIV